MTETILLMGRVFDAVGGQFSFLLPLIFTCTTAGECMFRISDSGDVTLTEGGLDLSTDGLVDEVGAAIFVTLDRGGLCVAREGFCADFFTMRSGCVGSKRYWIRRWAGFKDSASGV